MKKKNSYLMVNLKNLILVFLLSLINSNETINLFQSKKEQKIIKDPEKTFIYLTPKSNKVNLIAKEHTSLNLVMTMCGRLNNVKNATFKYDERVYNITINKTHYYKSIDSKIKPKEIIVDFQKNINLNSFNGIEFIYFYADSDEVERRIKKINQLNLKIKIKENMVYWDSLGNEKATYELYILEKNSYNLNNCCYLKYLKEQYKLNNKSLEYHELNDTKFILNKKGKYYFQVVAKVNDTMIFRVPYNYLYYEYIHDSYFWIYITLPSVFIFLFILMIIILNCKKQEEEANFPHEKLISDSINDD
jgi:hypothetical protein